MVRLPRGLVPAILFAASFILVAVFAGGYDGQMKATDPISVSSLESGFGTR